MKKQFTFLTLLFLIGAGKIFSQTLQSVCSLTVNASVTSNYNGAHISCNGSADGQASVLVAGEIGTLSYTWSAGNQSTPTATALGAGIYSVDVEDLFFSPGSCVVTATVEVIAPTALTQTLLTNSVTCNGLANGSATITPNGGTGAYSYMWSNGGNTATISGLAPGVYTHTLTDINACETVSNTIIIQPSALSQTISVTDVACFGSASGSATVSASGGTGAYTYLWSNSGNTAVLSGLASGVYTHTLTDVNSCSVTATATITELASTLLVPQSSITTSISCHGELAVVTVTATGGDSPYLGVGTFSVAAGVQTYTVTDDNGCALTTSVNITEPAALVASSSFTSLCGSAIANVTVSATGGTGAYTGTGTFTATAGAYSYTVTDANACSNTTTITVTTSTAVSTFSTGMKAASCFGKSDATAWVNPVISLPTETPFTYTWTPSASNTGTITNVAGGVYTVNITAANGCAYTRTVDVKQPAVLVLDMQVSPSTTICPATTTTLSVSGAATYTWSTGSNNPKIVVTPTVTTNYSVTGTSFLGCTVMSSVTIVTSTTTCLGVNELDNASVLVYPNPATENINVQLSSQLSNATFEVIDALGKVVMSQKMENITNIINISTLYSGVYFYQIKSGSRIIATQKFIKE